MARRAETQGDEAARRAALDADNRPRQEKRQVFNSAVAAARGRLLRVSAANQKKMAVVQKADKAMDGHKERGYRRGCGRVQEDRQCVRPTPP